MTHVCHDELYGETKMLNAMRGTAAAAPASISVGMFPSRFGESGTGGTEVSYEGYVRQQSAAIGPGDQRQHGQLREQRGAPGLPTPPGSSGTVTHVAVFDAQTGGNMLCYTALNNNIVLTSETSPRIQSGNVQLSLSAGNMDTATKCVLNWLRGTSISGFTSYLALYNGEPASGGTELTGTGYARMAISFAEPAEQVSGQMTMQNSTAMESAAANVNWEPGPTA